MKTDKNHKNRSNGAPKMMPVRFELTHPTATTVCVAGSFNRWQPEAQQLHPSGIGYWFKDFTLAPGTYEYCLIVDGQWMADPLVRESVPNPYGGHNSVVKVEGPVAPAMRTAA